MGTGTDFSRIVPETQVLKLKGNFSNLIRERRKIACKSHLNCGDF